MSLHFEKKQFQIQYSAKWKPQFYRLGSISQVSTLDKMTKLWLLLLLTSTSMSYVRGTNDLSKQETLGFLDRSLSSLNKGLNFLQEEHQYLNLDAVIGLSLTQGQLKVLLDNIKGGSSRLPADAVQRIEAVMLKADGIIANVIPYVKATQPLYYQRIGKIIESGFWTLNYTSRDMERALITKPLYDPEGPEAIREQDSDDCLVELLGSQSDQSCQISELCWSRMTAPGYSHYSLSHEVLYLEVGLVMGCFAVEVKPVVDQLNAKFCANLWNEADVIARRDFPENRKDFFMEIPALCGILGYHQFFTLDWLDAIISWQRQRGCWGLPQHQINVWQIVKREEKNFHDGCQCHRTAVAIGALTQYVRYIVEYYEKTSL